MPSFTSGFPSPISIDKKAQGEVGVRIHHFSRELCFDDVTSASSVDSSNLIVCIIVAFIFAPLRNIQ